VWTALGPPAPVDWDESPGTFTGLMDVARDRLLALSLPDHATWALPLGTPSSWSRLDIGGEAPPPRFQHSLAIDTDLDRVLMFGGNDGLDRGDLWALNLGAPTAVEVSLVSAEARPDEVAITWSLGGGLGPVSVERSLHESGAWQRLGDVSPDGTGRVSFVDRDVVPGTIYDYRLAYADAGSQRVGGAVTIVVPRTGPDASFALANAGANPSASGLTVTISLPDAAPARLEVHDVAGRRVVSREVGGLGAGRHTVEMGEARSLSPGLYLVRLVRGAEFRATRVAVVR
jgi:hypothetical protein